MKTKQLSKNTRIRMLFFALAFFCNLFLGFYLKDFLVLSPVLLSFYLLSALPATFLLTNARSRGMRAVIFVTLILILLLNFVYALKYHRVIAFADVLSLAPELLYFGALVENSHKDGVVTKITALLMTALIVVVFFSACRFVLKPEAPYFLNGGATLWDTKTEELADEICAGCDTDAEKVKAIHRWITHNFEYDDDYYPTLQYFDVRKTIRTRKGICYDFAHLFAALCRSQNIPCYAVNGDPRDPTKELHTWNRVYFDGAWWNVDVTYDITNTATGRDLYGFHRLESVSADDEAYFITRIY